MRTHVNAFVVEKLPVYRDYIRLDIAIISGRIEGMKTRCLVPAFDGAD